MKNRIFISVFCFMFCVISLPKACNGDSLAKSYDMVNNSQGKMDSSLILTWNPSYKLTFSIFVELDRGDPHNRLSSLTSVEQGRRFNIKQPGDYLSTPLWSIKPGRYIDFYTGEPIFIRADSIQNSKMTLYIENILTSYYRYSEINDNIFIYDNILNDSNRTEFYGRFQLNDTRFTFGGWFDKFAIAGVLCAYDGIDQFLDQAHKFFVLPIIDRNNITVKTEGNEYFYSVVDTSNMLMLRGFKARVVDPDNESSFFDTNIIEFTKYYDKEFIP
jgi:hypothetical protein